MESPILTYRPLRQLLKTDSYRAGHLCTCYIPMKFTNYHECRYVIAHLTSGAIFKTRSRFWRLPEWITNFQLLYFVSSNFYWPHILKGKAGEMHLQNHLLKKENILVVFPTGFDMKHDSESDKTASPHWVVVVSPLKYTMNLLFTPANQQRSWSRKGMDRRVEVRRS